jgi:mannan endo-1,4-beta-mannosidase
VSSGSWSPWAYKGGSNFQTMHESPNIDVGSIHEYDYDYNQSNTIESPHFASALKAMNNLNKALLVGETGIESGDDCRTDRQTRVKAIKQKFDIYLEKGAAVVLVWNLAQSTKGCGFTFPVTDPLLDMIKTYPINNERR